MLTLFSQRSFLRIHIVKHGRLVLYEKHDLVYVGFNRLFELEHPNNEFWQKLRNQNRPLDFRCRDFRPDISNNDLGPHNLDRKRSFRAFAQHAHVDS